MAAVQGAFKVTPEYLTMAAGACNATASEIQDDLAQLQLYIQNMEAWWQGIASGVFQDLMVQYSTYSTMLYNALTDIANGLHGTYVNYTTTEQSNISTINSIQQALGGTNFT